MAGAQAPPVRPDPSDQRAQAAYGRAPLRSDSGRFYVFNGQRAAAHRAPAYGWPAGRTYYRLAPGMYLAREFWLPQYYVSNTDDYGLDYPPPGFMWLRYGPDLVLMNIRTGYVRQSVYDFFDDGAPPPPGYDPAYGRPGGQPPPGPYDPYGPPPPPPYDQREPPRFDQGGPAPPPASPDTDRGPQPQR